MMDTLMIKVQSDKKDFFLALIKELTFVEIDETFTAEQEAFYIEAIEESEVDINQENVTNHQDLKKEIHQWRK